MTDIVLINMYIYINTHDTDIDYYTYLMCEDNYSNIF